MVKYIHKDLAKFIKSDVNNIKFHNQDLKKTNIADTLATFFGWTHFNELETNTKREHIPHNDCFFNISKMNCDDLNSFKSTYLTFINNIFYKDVNIKKKSRHDPFSIMDGLFGQLNNEKTTIIKNANNKKPSKISLLIGMLKNSNNKKTLNLSLVRGDTHIKINNNDVEKITTAIIKKMEKDKDKNNIWPSRNKVYQDAIFDAMKKDNTSNNYQLTINEAVDFKKLVSYYENHNYQIKCEKLRDYLINMPRFTLGGDVELQTKEAHGFLVMAFQIFKQEFLNPDLRNIKTITLDEIRNFDGIVSVTHFDTPDVNNDLNLLSQII